MVPPRPGSAALLLLFCLAVGIGEAPATPAEEQHLGLLDFLGSWQDEDGQWIDPFTLTLHPPPRLPVNPEPTPNVIPAEAHKPVQEKPLTSAKDRPRNP